MAEEKKESKELVKAEPAGAISPFKEMEKWIEEMDRWFEEAFRRPFSLLRPSWFPRISREIEFSPSVDIYEEKDDVIVKAELPGMKKEDIEVNIKDDILTISGEKKSEEKVEKKGYYRMERSYGSFCRSFRLPDVQMDKAKAKFENGVLEIRIPKSEEAKKKEKKLLIE